MARYYVNDKAQANGDHEVLRDGCSFMPSAANRTSLGEYPSCATAAVVAAKRIHRQSNGCYSCSRECHTGSVTGAGRCLGGAVPATPIRCTSRPGFPPARE